MTSSRQERLSTGGSPRSAVAPPRPPKPTTFSHGRPVAPLAAGVVRGSSASPPQPQEQPPVLERRLRFSATACHVHARRMAAGRVAVDGTASGGVGGVSNAPQDDGDAAPSPQRVRGRW